VDADETELQQVMFNLVINARDAMPGGGRLTITTGTESFPAPRPAAGGGQLAAGRWRFVRVDDTGPGIDPGSRERIFEPFFTTKPVGVGTGLGLWTVLSIASASGGGVLVGGEPGQGARLTVYFPEPATQAVVARAPMAVVAPPRATASRILLLEDDTSVRRLMTTVLERAGHQVVAVGDGRKALEEIARRGEHFDLLCSDAVVPQVPAGRVIDAFLAAFPSRPVLVVSGYVEEELTRNGIEQGRCHLLRKPFPPEELCRTVDRLQVAPA
jgi:two-component system cell cycle sensor histidine kinase/response regulator CckA